jgi:hypothetical protein
MLKKLPSLRHASLQPLFELRMKRTGLSQEFGDFMRRLDARATKNWAGEPAYRSCRIIRRKWIKQGGQARIELVPLGL